MDTEPTTQELKGESELSFTTVFVTCLKWFSGVSSMWGLILPIPNARDNVLVVLIFLPLLVIILLAVSRGEFQLNGEKDDPRPTLGVVLFFPAIVLGLRAMFDGTLYVNFLTAIGACCIAAIPLAVAICFLAQRKGSKPTSVLAILLIMIFYTGGAGTLGNVLLDFSTPQNFQVSVLERFMYIPTGRGSSSPSPRLRLAPWGPQHHGAIVPVFPQLVGIKTGDIVCITQHAGAFSWRWYVVDNCSESVGRISSNM